MTPRPQIEASRACLKNGLLASGRATQLNQHAMQLFKPQLSINVGDLTSVKQGLFRKGLAAPWAMYRSMGLSVTMVKASRAGCQNALSCATHKHGGG